MRRLFSKRTRLEQLEWNVGKVQLAITRLHEVDEKSRRSITELARRVNSLESITSLLESHGCTKIDVNSTYVATSASAYVNDLEARKVWVEPEVIQVDIVIDQGTMNPIVFKKTTTLEELNSFIASLDLSKHQTIKLTDSARPGELLVVPTKDIRKIWTRLISKESAGDHS